MSRTLTVRLACAVAVSGCLTGACVDMVGADLGRFTEREEKHFSVAGKPDVELATFDGSIDVQSWDKAEVSVEIEKRGRDRRDVEAIDVHADQTGNHIVVEIRSERSDRGGLHINWHNSRSARLVVTLPASAN